MDAVRSPEMIALATACTGSSGIERIAAAGARVGVGVAGGGNEHEESRVHVATKMSATIAVMLVR